MPRLNILLGPAGSGKSTALFSGVINEAEKDIRKNHLVIVPEQVSHAVTDRLISLSARQGILNIDVLSFNRLAHRIFDNAGGNTKEIIDDTGKNLILRTVVSEHEKELTVLKKNISRPGCINEIKSVISEFVQYEIRPEDVLKLSEGKEKKYLSAKLKDIYILYKAFREKIEEKFVTREELLDRAAEAAKRAEFLKGAHIYFDDFTGFTPIQYRFLTALFNYVEEASVSLDYDGKDGELFSLSVTTIGKIREIAENAHFEINTLHFYETERNRFLNTPGLRQLEKCLFRETSSPVEAGEAVSIVKTCNPEREAEYVIHEVMKLVRQGLRYREIGIVMSKPEVYSRILSAEAEREGVPLFIDSTTEILLNPYTEFIRSAIEAVVENLSYESVFHFVRSGLTGILDKDGDRLENYVRAMNIRGRKKYSEPFRIHTKRLSEEELELINAARESLISLLGPFTDTVSGGAKPVKQYTAALKDFILNSGIDEKMEALSEKLEEEGDLRGSDLIKRVPEQVSEFISRMESLIPDERMSLREFSEILDAGFEAIKTGVLPPGLDCVKAGDTERSRFDNIRVLFFMGLNDGLIPASNTGKGLLSDFDREFIKEKGVEVSPTARERIGLSRLYFYMNVTKPSEKLILSYSLSDSDGKALNPSLFLSDIKSVFLSVKEVLYEERDELFSESDLYSDFASSLRGGRNIDRARLIYTGFSKDPHKKQVFDNILDFCFKLHGEDRISTAVINALYGNPSEYSPSRLERYAECAYRHFMIYGIKAMEREEFGFERRDLGSLLHNVLNLYSSILKEKGKSYRDPDSDETQALAEEALERYLSENENVVLLSSERNKYFIRRIGRILHSTVLAVKKQSERGSFDPEMFEQEFKLRGLKGRIDRIDSAKEGNTLYVSVIDYKSGNKAFDISRVYYGLDLQLVIYLSGEMEIERIAHPGTEVKPAGIFYYHIDDPVIKEGDLRSGSDTELQEKKLEAVKLRGIVNSEKQVIRLFDSDFEKASSVVPVSFNKDGSFSSSSSVADTEDFKVIEDYVRRKVLEIRERISQGEIEPSPAVLDGKSPCSYCEFSDCCRFDRRTPGFRERRLKKINGITETVERMKDSSLRSE